MANLTPGGWLELLDARLRERHAAIQLYEDYFNGKHRLSFATEKFRSTFGAMFASFADNWCKLIVNAAVERLHVEGFRFGTSPAADNAAWAIWQANGLDADARIAHREAVKCGEAYILVDPNGGPRITVEHPAEAIVAMQPGNRRQRVAGLKRWIDIDGHAYATLFLPDYVYKFRSQNKASYYMGSGKVNWTRRDDDPGGTNRLGAVPLVPLCNNPSMIGGGQSDLDDAICLNDAINKTIADALVSSEYQAFAQRWAVGIDVPKDPTTGQPLANTMVEMAISRLMVSESPDAKFGAFPQVDLKPYVAMVEMLVQHLAAQTRTPPHYLLGQSGAFPSGEALSATEAGLVARVVEKQTSFGEAWEEALRLVFAAKGDMTKASAFDAETIWRDPESRTEGQHIDATLKLQALGVPREALWERAGFTPQQIRRFRKLNEQEAKAAPSLPAAPDTEGPVAAGVALPDSSNSSLQ